MTSFRQLKDKTGTGMMNVDLKIEIAIVVIDGNV